MWTRSELKYRAKDVLRKCFWAAVVVCLISGLFAGEFGTGGSGGRGSSNESTTIWDSARDLMEGDLNSGNMAQRAGAGIARLMSAGFYTIFMMFGLFVLFASFLISIFVGYPILVGSKRFFMKSREEKTSVADAFFVFKSGSMLNVVKIVFMQNLKTFLWSLLLIVPGIIKSYEYRMIPFILSENPEIGMGRAFELSREMMNGEKWNTFVLDLSFILWYLAGFVTCSLANVFFVNPYVAATNAELYAVLRGQLLANGAANSYELPGYLS